MEHKNRETKGPARNATCLHTLHNVAGGHKNKRTWRKEICIELHADGLSSLLAE